MTLPGSPAAQAGLTACLHPPILQDRSEIARALSTEGTTMALIWPISVRSSPLSPGRKTLSRVWWSGMRPEAKKIREPPSEVGLKVVFMVEDIRTMVVMLATTDDG